MSNVQVRERRRNRDWTRIGAHRIPVAETRGDIEDGIRSVRFHDDAETGVIDLLPRRKPKAKR